MFEALGGVPHIVVPDNLRSAVTKPGRHPVIHRTYQEMATYYGTVILPARARRPKDKAKVEGGVLIVQRWVLLRLRHRTFFSLAELTRPLSSWSVNSTDVPSRRWRAPPVRFEGAEQSVLQPLPGRRYEYGEWTASQTVPPDYHVALGKHWYSCRSPHRRAVEGRLTADTVEIYSSGIRMASHRRGAPGGTTTDPAHRPKHHAAYAERTPEYFLHWAQSVGPATVAFVQHNWIAPIPALDCRVAIACNLWPASSVRSSSKPPHSGRWRFARCRKKPCAPCYPAGGITQRVRTRMTPLLHPPSTATFVAAPILHLLGRPEHEPAAHVE